MSFDTKYRPTDFGGVIGQAATVNMLQELVKSGAGFHQSYLFCGPFGSGKTTLGRILARALLCDSPVDGNPCDKCPSCTTILESGSSVDFVEVDAATNSGKDNIRRIIEQISYSSFSGKRRIYLFDEAHQLSRDALDALLKPMEDAVSGTDDKRLVCIFCTTEPEKMRATVVSRCAPAFMIRHAPNEDVANRLGFVCDQEGIAYEKDALSLIAEVSEAHIRDALKSLEGISLMGDVTKGSVGRYLHLDVSMAVMHLIEAMAAGDAALATKIAKDLLQVHSPALLYKRIATSSMTLYALGLGAGTVPSWWDQEAAKALSELGSHLIAISNRFASRPGRVTESVFLCDVALACQGLVSPVISQTSTIQNPPTGSTFRGKSIGKVYQPVAFQSSPSIVGGAYLDPRGVNKTKVENGTDEAQTKQPQSPSRLSPSAFSDHVVQRLLELNEDGPTRQTDMGDT